MRIIAALMLTISLMICAACDMIEKKISVVAVEDDREEIVATVPAHEGLPLMIKFTHSVQKTPVEEDLEFDGKNFIVQRTRYKSQGVGLPFDESDGEFRREGDYFVMDNMNRRIDNLSLRTGVGTNMTIVLDGQEIRLYEMYEPGTRIDIRAD